MLQLKRSAVVMSEVRQLIVEKRLDVLLLQEPHVKKQGSSHIFVGLGVGMRVAAERSQRPWAAMVVYEIEKHLRHFETVFHTLRGKRLIVAVDANARLSLWCPQEIDNRGAHLLNGKSDHNSVDIRLRVPREQGEKCIANTRFDIHQADWERLSKSLADLSRSKLGVLDLQSADDVEKMAETLAIV
ncbi:hypothetical protein RF55_12867, partial [Lasius niger]